MRSRHPPIWALLATLAMVASFSYSPAAAAQSTKPDAVAEVRPPDEGNPAPAEFQTHVDSVFYEVCAKVFKVGMSRDPIERLIWIELADGRKSVRPARVGLTRVPIYPNRYYNLSFTKAGHARITPARSCGADARSSARHA